MSKRIVAGALWFVAGAYLGSYLAYSSGTSEMLAPLLGALGALMFAGDPFHVVWTRPARDASPSGPTVATLVSQDG